MSAFIITFFGGLLIGLSMVMYLYLNGRVAGISGIIAQTLFPASITSLVKSPALWFLLGLILTSAVYGVVVKPHIELITSPLWLGVAGLLVGFGTRLGSGCTSGHGICGVSRLSVRSMVATAVFMLLGFITVFVLRHF